MPSPKPVKLRQDQIATALDMAFRGANNHMIADKIGVKEEKLLRLLGKDLRQKRIDRKMEILDCQTAMLKAGSNTMAVWLGRNELDQSEERRVTVDIPPGSIILEIVDHARSRSDSSDTESGG